MTAGPPEPDSAGLTPGDLTPPPDLTPAQRRAGLVVAMLCIAVAAFALGLTLPLIALLLEGRGYSSTAIGINSAMAPLAILISSPFVPRWIARYGAKRFILFCIACSGLLLLAFKPLDSYAVWLVLRFLNGITIAGLFVGSESWINQVAEPRTRTRTMAVYNIVLSAGFASGPLILGAIGVDGWLPFLLGSAVMGIATLPMIFVPVVAPVFDGKPSFSVWTYALVAPTLAGALLLYAMIENSTSSLISVFGRHSGLDDAPALALLSTVILGGVVFAWPVGWLGDRMDKIRLMMVLAGVGAVGALSLPFLVDAPVLRGAVLFVWGGAGASLYTLAMALQGERFQGSDLVTANAAYGVLYGMGSLAGPAITGVAMDLDDPNGYAWTMATICCVFLVFTFIRQRLKRRGGAF